VRSIACSGALVAAGSGCRGTLRLWDVSHAPRAHVDGGGSLGNWQEHRECVRGLWLRHPLLISGSSDGLCKVWDVRCRRSAATLFADCKLLIGSLSVMLTVGALLLADVHSLAFDGGYRLFAGAAGGTRHSLLPLNLLANYLTLKAM
jgi:WD40 repeat protein